MSALVAVPAVAIAPQSKPWCRQNLAVLARHHGADQVRGRCHRATASSVDAVTDLRRIARPQMGAVTNPQSASGPLREWYGARAELRKHVNGHECYKNEHQPDD